MIHFSEMKSQDVAYYTSPVIFGGAKEPGMMYFPTKGGAKEPQNPQNPQGCYTSPRSSVIIIFH